jgi:hypothetical protein
MCALVDVDMVAEQYRDCRRGCCVRPVHVRDLGWLRRKRDHDLARKLQRGPHFVVLQQLRRTRARQEQHQHRWAHLVRSSVSRAGEHALTAARRNLYSGSNGANAVWSFLPTSGTIPSFSGDIKAFLTVRRSVSRPAPRTDGLSVLQYLINNEGLSSSQYLTTAQAGTEATSGSATLTTYAFHLFLLSRAMLTSGTSTAYSLVIN